MICQECGSIVSSKKRICPNCGAKISKELNEELEIDENKIFNLILAIILILIPLSLVITYWFNGLPIIVAILVSIMTFITSFFIPKSQRKMRFIGRVLDLNLLIMAIISIINL